ncbi:MAG: DMT family transporter, partial [Chloroflexi bacterium]|nr:DMT family transporter [Chloroflexota bacterium]
GVELPSPLDRAWLFATVAVLAAAGLAVAFRSGQAYLAVAGLFGAAFIVAAASLAPRLGVALLLSAVTAGTLAGALTMDHLGAFGGEVQRVTVTRLVGVLVVMVGVVIVRSR